MIARDCIAPSDVLKRYQGVTAKLRAEGSAGPDGTRSYNRIEHDPATGYNTGEIFMGSHISADPSKSNFIRTMSFRPEPGVGEHILDEAFVQRTERTLGDRIQGRPGKSVLYHFVQELTTGSHVIDAVMGVYDLGSGQLIAEKHEGAAYKAADRLQAEEGLYTPGGAGILT